MLGLTDYQLLWLMFAAVTVGGLFVLYKRNSKG